MTPQTTSLSRRIITRINQIRRELSYAQRRLFEIRTGIEPTRR